MRLQKKLKAILTSLNKFHESAYAYEPRPFNVCCDRKPARTASPNQFFDSPIMAKMRFVWEKPKTAKSSIG